MGIIDTIKTNLANRKNYGNSRNVNTIKFLVIHYTGNDGDTDENNGKYFHNNVTGTSAHYFVDDDSITQSVPDNYTAWHCGGKVYRHKECRNANSIGIEICDDVRNGTIYPSAKTIENVLELTRYKMKQYNIPKENVIRHYDVTGKLCPAYWVDNTKWKTEFWNKLDAESKAEKPAIKKIDPAKSFSKSYAKTYTTTANLNMRCGAGTIKSIVTTIPKGGKVTCYGYYTKQSDGTIWLLVKYKGYTGFCSKGYLK